MITRRHLLLLLALCGIALASILISLASGSVPISASDLLSLLGKPHEGLEQQVVLELRMPRTFAAFITGALLALSGVVMQVLLRNPLADPYILGISGGASVAALSAILLGLGSVAIANSAFAGAILSITIVFGLSGRSNTSSSIRLLLTGVVVSAGWGALINILLTTSANNSVYSMLFWLMGDLSQSKPSALSATVLIVGLLILLSCARSLNMLNHGERHAASLGVNVGSLRMTLFGAASLMTACAVTLAGAIGFVGLIVPHMLRLIGARDHRILIPSSALLGGSFLVLADSVARTVIAPIQLPVGVITALIGVPAFLIILRSNAALSARRS
ncbi:MAG: iron ABC transporter permease [Pseudohongiellaceae bacterium]|nr:iron ABC transporter permease [Pseudohongiellaceae bacterium]